MLLVWFRASVSAPPTRSLPRCCSIGTSASRGSGWGRHLISVSANGLNDLGIPGTNNAGAPGDPSLYYGYPGFIFPTKQAPPGTTITDNQCKPGQCATGNPFLFRDQQYVTGANLSWNKGKHAFRGGIEWNHAQINHFQPQGGTFQQPRGAFEFNGLLQRLCRAQRHHGSIPGLISCWVCRAAPAKPERSSTRMRCGGQLGLVLAGPLPGHFRR